MPISFVRLPRMLIAIVSGPITHDQLEAYLPVLAANKDETIVVDLAAAEGLDTATLDALSSLADHLAVLDRPLYIAAPGKTTQAQLEEAALLDRAVILTDPTCLAN